MEHEPRLLKSGILTLLALLAVMMLPGQAAAQKGLTSAFFVNAGMGQGRMSMELASLDAQPASIGNPAPSPSSTTATGGEFGAGHVFDQPVLVEGAYNKLGSFSYRNPSPVPTVGVSIKATAWSLFGVGTLPISSGLSAFGKLGLAYTQLKANAVELLVHNNSTNKMNFAWGLGAQHDFTQNLAVRLEYENFGNVGSAPNFTAGTGIVMGTTSVIFLGGLYRF